MAKIEGIRIANYRVLKDLTLGKLWNTQRAQPLTPLSVVIGKNGVGKSSLFDAFCFLADCLKLGVEEACDARGRGGFERIRSQGSYGPIEFEIYYREEPKARPITYELVIDRDDTGRPYVSGERLRQRRKGQKHGQPFSFLMMNDGRGLAWKGEAQGQQIDEAKGMKVVLESIIAQIAKRAAGEESAESEIVELQDRRKLGIATLGALKQHPRISSFRQFVEGWYLSYFTPHAARSLPLAGPQKHLNVGGDNLGNVVEFMEREQPDRFRDILKRIAGRIPGIDRIDTERSPDGRLLLRFNDKGFRDPFYAQQMSDGTLKVFAYLIMLADPQPPLDVVLEKILGKNAQSHSWRLHPYKGIGRIPKNLQAVRDPQKRLLLDHLPRLLRGYGRSLQPGRDCVVVVLDLDHRHCVPFRREMLNVLNACNPRPRTLFRIAIEEGEAWLLGDRCAVRAAYPSAKDPVLNGYRQDSICGTWEVLADAVHPGGSARLKKVGYPGVGKAKCEWAGQIAPHMDVNGNRSPSFRVFRDGVRDLAGI